MAITPETIRMRLAEHQAKQKSKSKPEDLQSLSEVIIKLIDAVHAENGEYEREYLARLANHLSESDKKKLCSFLDQKRHAEEAIRELTKSIPNSIQKQELVNWVKENFSLFEEQAVHFVEELRKTHPHFIHSFKKEKIMQLLEGAHKAINSFVENLPVQPQIKSKL